jgi:hypothetical protein
MRKLFETTDHDDVDGAGSETVDLPPTLPKQHADVWKKESPTSSYHLPSSAHSPSHALTGEASNKTILLCPAITPLHLGAIGKTDGSDEITFILPHSTLAYLPTSGQQAASIHTPTYAYAGSQQQARMVQLTCRVTDLQIAPLDIIVS